MVDPFFLLKEMDCGLKLWFDNRRLLGPIGNIPPAEAQQNVYAQRDVLGMVA